MLAEIFCIPVFGVCLQGKINEHSCLVAPRSSIPTGLSSAYPGEAGNVFTQVENALDWLSARFEDTTWRQEFEILLSGFQNVLSR